MKAFLLIFVVAPSLIGWFGFVMPALLSAKDTLLNVLGVGVTAMVAAIVYLLLFIKQRVESK